jgi:hypothetical protein
MPIDSHLPQADPFSLVPTFKKVVCLLNTFTRVTLTDNLSQQLQTLFELFFLANCLRLLEYLIEFIYNFNGFAWDAPLPLPISLTGSDYFHGAIANGNLFPFVHFACGNRELCNADHALL